MRLSKSAFSVDEKRIVGDFVAVCDGIARGICKFIGIAGDEIFKGIIRGRFFSVNRRIRGDDADRRFKLAAVFLFV